MGRVASFALAFCFVLSASVVAQDTRITPGINSGRPANSGPKMGEGKYGETETGEGESCESGECPVVAKAMEALPKMVFRIGDDETCCHMTATQMAREAHEEIVFVVGKKKFRDSQDAFESLVKETESYVKKSLTPSVCEESGSTFIAGQTCECAEATTKFTELVQNTVAGMKMTYSVGEQTFDKYTDARRHARKTHGKGMYVVDGEKFENEYEARLSLAHKKYRSAVSAIQQVKTGDTANADSEPKTEQPAEKPGKNLPNMKIG